MSLNRISPETYQILLELFIFLILPILVNILLIKVVLFRGDKRRLYLSVPQVLPGKIFQPGMIFYLIGTVKSKSVRRFSLDHLIYKVGRLNRPALGDLISLDLYLFCQNMVSDFLPRLADIGPLKIES